MKQSSLIAAGAARDRTKRASFLLSLNSPNSALGRFSESTSPLQSNVEQKRRLELADWTGRQVRKGKRGLIPEHIAPILESLEVNTQHWVKTVENHGSLFHRLVARADDMAKAARGTGSQMVLRRCPLSRVLRERIASHLIEGRECRIQNAARIARKL